MTQPLSLQLTPGYEVASSHKSTIFPILLDINASITPEQASRPPVTLGLCIDNSGSMDGEPLELVKHAVSLVLDQLQPGDRVGLVSFSNEANVWLAPTALTEASRNQLKNALSQIEADCATAMYDGLQTTLRAMPSLRPDELSHVWLLTDGHPNEGPSSAEELSAMTKEWRRNTVVSTFGFGAHHNEDMLQDIARAGGGRYTLIDHRQAIPTAFAMALGALFTTVAKDVLLTIQPSERCVIRKIHGDNEARYTSRGLELKLSDWIVGQSLSLLMEVELTPENKWETSLDCGAFILDCYLPSQETPLQQRLPFLMSMAPTMPEVMHPKIVRQQLLVQANDAWKAARGCADQGQYMEAIRALEPCMIALQEHADWHDETSAVRDWYEQFVEERDLFVQRPDRQWYQDFRKQAKAEMVVPGMALGCAGAAAHFSASAAQKEMIQRFRGEEGEAGTLEIWERDQFQGFYPITHEVSIGRVQGNDIVLAKGNVSKRHARVVPTTNGCVLVDLRSSNGLFLNGHKLQSPSLLKEGDHVFVGDFVFVYRNPASPADAAPAPMPPAPQPSAI